MTIGVLATVALTLALVITIFARQLMRRPITQRSVLVPLALGVVLGVLFWGNHPASRVVATVVIGVALGLVTGLVSGQFVRVWRDEATSVVFQHGGWRYLGVIIVLLVARLLIRFILIWTGAAVDETALNAGFLAAVVGNLLGRDIVVALRALPLVRGGWASLPSR